MSWGQEGDLLFDPFGTSPHLVIEAAKEGRAVLVATGNPIQSFLIQSLASSHSRDELRAALGYLAGLPKDGTRMEPFLLDLYRTQCLHCGADAVADYFIWDRDSGQITLKAYVCDGCHFAGEVMATEDDQLIAERYAESSLQRSIAMDRIVAADDPDRRNVRDALDAYPDRTLYALVTILNKLDQLPPGEDMAPGVRALMLSALDAGTKLWGHPEGRARPRQLTASPQYREINVWRALEKAVLQWSWRTAPNPVQIWQEGCRMEPGTITIFPGPVRDLNDAMAPDPISMVLTIPPRHNQAYWTLSALWAAWLWGKEKAGTLRAALRRRRYDWNWHAIALRSVLRDVRTWLPDERGVMLSLPEVEPGYLAATVAGMAGSGYVLQGAALRMDDQQALLYWQGDEMPAGSSTRPPELSADVTAIFEERGEPCAYPLVHGYTWCALAERNDLATGWLANPEQPLQPVLDQLHAALDDRTRVREMHGGVEWDRREYWLASPSAALIPLADRVEDCVLSVLQVRRYVSLLDLDVEVCRALPGRLTPSRAMVSRCLDSYAEEEEGVWRLRREDETEVRLRDVEDIIARLCGLGEQLQYDVTHDSDQVTWCADDEIRYRFRVQSSAHLAPFLHAMNNDECCLVIPGGRARLFAEKMRRDPRVESKGRVIKFRHVRRLAEEGLTNRSMFEARLAIDPPAYQDPQLPLL